MGSRATRRVLRARCRPALGRWLGLEQVHQVSMVRPMVPVVLHVSEEVSQELSVVASRHELLGALSVLHTVSFDHTVPGIFEELPGSGFVKTSDSGSDNFAI